MQDSDHTLLLGHMRKEGVVLDDGREDMCVHDSGNHRLRGLSMLSGRIDEASDRMRTMLGKSPPFAITHI